MQIGARIIVAVVCAHSMLFSYRAEGLDLRVNYVDDADEGFYDPNLGSLRRGAFQFAVDYWSNTLAGTARVIVNVAMNPLGGSGTSALLASTRASTIHRNFSGAKRNVWYGAALANQLAHADLNGQNDAEMEVVFNGDVDNPEVLGSINWYYGLDGKPDVDTDFVTVALHELGHGLGFFSLFTRPADRFPNDLPSIFDLMLFRPGVGGFGTMLDSERVAASVFGDLEWNSPRVRAIIPTALVFAPRVFRSGSSIGHWDDSLAGELMTSSYQVPQHDPGLLIPALLDMGWRLAGTNPTPPDTEQASLTPTPSPTATQPSTLPGRPYALALVANFESGNVSILDQKNKRVLGVVAVGAGPLSIARVPNSRLAVITEFREGAVSFLDAAQRAITSRLYLDSSSDAACSSPDGQRVYVSNPSQGTITEIDVKAQQIVGRISIGDSVSALVMEPGGKRLWAAAYASETLYGVDTLLHKVTALIPLGLCGPVDLIAHPETHVVYVACKNSGEVRRVDLDLQEQGIGPAVESGMQFSLDNVLSLAVPSNTSELYIGLGNPGSGRGRVNIIDSSGGVLSREVGRWPVAMELTSDRQEMWVANRDSDSISIINTAGKYVSSTIATGTQPSALAMLSFSSCQGDCNADGMVTLDELIRTVAIALGRLDIERCAPADTNLDGMVTIDEILAAVSSALGTC